MKEFEYSKCICGAVTVFIRGQSYSCKLSNKKKYLPNIDLRKGVRYQTTYCCDHCVNHYGLDLCGCGCGEPVGKCANRDEKFKSVPMQKLMKYNHVVASDSPLSGLRVGGVLYV